MDGWMRERLPNVHAIDDFPFIFLLLRHALHLYISCANIAHSAQSKGEKTSKLTFRYENVRMHGT